MLQTARPTSPSRTRRLARTAGFMLAAVAVAGGAFLAVLKFEPVAGVTAPTTRESTGVAVIGPDPPLHNGSGPIVRPKVVTYDGGRLASEFTAEQFTPRTDGSIDVTRPFYKFYLSHGECLTVVGETGEVSFNDVGSGGGGGAGTKGGMPTAMHMPDRGWIHHVHIERFASVANTRPTLTMDTDNVWFDNDTLRLYTQSYVDADGRTVAADRVPVTVRGDDYEMDGTGLTLRWNGRDRRLHLLEIAHGHRLTLLHPNTLQGAGQGKIAAVPAASAPAEPAAKPLGSVAAAPTVLASSTAAPPTTTATAPLPYRAVFNDGVVVKQADQTIAQGDVLTLDFLGGHAAAVPPSTPVPLAPPPPPTTVPTPPPTTAPAPVTPAKPKPGSEPVTIWWTGKLRVMPLETAATLMPLSPGQAAVRLVGAPATLAYNGATATAASATFRSGDQAVQLEPSADLPTVDLADAKGTTLSAVSVALDPATSVAAIVGPATLVKPLEGGRTLTARWADRGLLHFATDGANRITGVDHVDLAGDVHAVEPSAFELDSHRLLLDLDVVPSTKPSTAGGGGSAEHLRRLTAVGAVACRMVHAGQEDRGIDADRLVVGLTDGPDGSPAPHDVRADGHVRVSDAQQAMTADHLQAVLAAKPSTRPATTEPTSGPTASVALDSLLATGHVRAVLKNGSEATGDALREATTPDGRQLVELSGSSGATVTTEQGDWLVGSVLHIAPDRNVVVVDGPGTLHAVGKPTTRPTGPAGGHGVDVSWADGMSFDATANTADVLGHVVARTVDARGTVNTVNGDAAHIDLANGPAKPAARPAHDGPADNLGGKTVKALTLTGHVHAKSLLVEGGVVVRHGELVDVGRLVYSATDGTVRVPGPGKLFVENHREAGNAPVAADGSGGSQGMMAVTWQTGMVYDQASDQITITGNARVGFQQDKARPGADGKAAAPMQLWSQALVITLQKPPADHAAAGGPPQQGKPQVSRMQATGAVRFRDAAVVVDCHSADYHLDAGRLVAKGSDAEPGRAVDAGGRGVGTVDGGFDELEFDTVRDEVVRVAGVHGAFRR